jgi:hypothetical protein
MRPAVTCSDDNTYPFDVVKVAFTDARSPRPLQRELADARRRLAPNRGTAGSDAGVRAPWSTLIRTRVRDVRIEADRSVYGGRTQRDRGNAQFASGGMRLSPRCSW